MKNRLSLNRRSKKIVINFLLIGISLIGIYGVHSLLNTVSNEEFLKGISIIYPFLFIVEVLSYNKVFLGYKKHETIFQILFSLFFAGTLLIGSQLDNYSDIIWTFGTLAKIICLATFIYPFIEWILNIIKKKRKKSLKTKNRKKFFLMTFFIVLVAGIIVWLASFPGIWGFDAATQFSTITNVDPEYTASVGAHYSLPLGWLMTNIIIIGKNIFGNYQLGLGLCCLIQLVIMSYIATRIIVFSAEKTNNIYLYIFSLMFFSLFPLYTAMTIYMTQDTIFAGMFALIFIRLNEMAGGECYWSKKNIAILITLMLGFCLCRNNGLYCLIVALPFALMATQKGKRIVMTVIFVVPMLLYSIYNGPILRAMGISTTSSINEIMSVPSQQIARVYTQNMNILNDGDKEKINLYYKNYKNFVEYNTYPSISDFSKRYLNRKTVSEDLFGYLKLWGSVGVRDPKNYIEAFLLNNLGFWYFNKNYPDERMGIPYFEYHMTDRGDDRFLVIERNSMLPFYDDYLESVLVENKFIETPIFAILCKMGPYFILLCFLIGITITCRRWKNFTALSLAIGLIATLLLSPVAVFRYFFPVFIIWPVLVSMIMNCFADEKK